MTHNKTIIGQTVHCLIADCQHSFQQAITLHIMKPPPPCYAVGLMLVRRGPSPHDSLGLMASRGTQTLVKQISAPLAGLSWLMGRTGERERKAGLPGVMPTAWLLTKELARVAGTEPRAGGGTGAEKGETSGAAAPTAVVASAIPN